MTPNGNIDTSLLSLTAAFLSIALLFVVLRFWARHTTAATYGPDDWLIVVGLVSQDPTSRSPKNKTEGSQNLRTGGGMCFRRAQLQE